MEISDMGSANSERKDMRRKLFFVTVILIALLYIIDGAGLPLRKGINDQWPGEQDYIASVIRTETGKEKIRLVAEISDGDCRGRRVLITCRNSEYESWKYQGCIIRFRGEISLAPAHGNPGCFDYRKYLLSKGIEGIVTADSPDIIEEPQNIWAKAGRFLEEKKYCFAESLSGELRGIMSGILFGDTSLIDEDVYEDFRVNGTAHVLAVSGLHVAILYGIIRKISGKRQSAYSFLFSVMPVITYQAMAMWSPSAVRAGGMLILKTLSLYTDRRYDTLSAMSFMAIVLIAVNPYVIFGSGFQMSFLAAASIAFIMPHIPCKIPEGIAVTLSVSLGLMPYQWYSFNYISVTAPAVNVPVIFLSSILLPLSMLVFIFFSAGIRFMPAEYAAEALLNFTVKINDILTMNGIGGKDVASPPLWCILLFYTGAFFLMSEQFTIMRLRKHKKRIIAVLSVLLIASIAAGVIFRDETAGDAVVFVDVGQGDCIHIRDGSTNIFIDGGGRADYNVGKKVLKPYLLKNGTSYVDMAMATHSHTDHLKGLKELKAEGMCGEIRKSLTSGKMFEVSENLKIEVLWPVNIDDDPQQNRNENSSVFMVYYYRFRILVTGDLDQEGEKRMMKYYKGKEKEKLKADILKVGHHGSRYSSSEEFLNIVEPEYCVVQVGKNIYGHPHSKIIEICSKKGIMIFRNDLDGAVGFSFKEDEIIFHTTRKAAKGSYGLQRG